MSKPDGTFREYLAAKRTVDDRALNARVLDALETTIAGETGLRVLNVGAGIGAALERFLERGLLPNGTTYTLLDARAATIETARERLPAWAERAGYATTETDDGLRITNENRMITVEFVVADAFEHVETGTWDLVVGDAFLDLFDTRAAFDALRGALAPGGLFYFPITFDGGTVFEPTVDPALDRRIETAYHAAIDDGGDSHAGRHLLAHAAETAAVIAAGSSDWVVYPHANGYPAEEAFFLDYIVDTVAGALEASEIDPAALADWAATRHRQIENGELVYVAHQLDVFGRVPAEAGKHG